MLPDLPGWDSLSAVNRYHSVAEITGIVILAALVVAEVISYKYGNRKDFLTEQQQHTIDQRHDEEMARLQRETAKANERAAELEKEANEFKERYLLFEMPRMVLASQECKKHLKDRPTGTMEVVWLRRAPDAEWFASQIASCFSGNGLPSLWNVEEPKAVDELPPGVTGIGVTVLAKKMGRYPFEEITLSDIAAMALKPGIERLPGGLRTGIDPSLPDGFVRIFVGSKL